MNEKTPFLKKAGTRSVMASIIAILIGIVVGCLVVLTVSLLTKVQSDDTSATFHYYKTVLQAEDGTTTPVQYQLTKNVTEGEDPVTYYTYQLAPRRLAYFLLREEDEARLIAEGTIPEDAQCSVIDEKQITSTTELALRFNAAWDGIRLVAAGIFSTGRNNNGALTFGFNGANIGNMLFRASPWPLPTRRACSTSAPPASISPARR